MINPIQVAVAPLKNDAIERAAQEASRMVDHFRRRLAECENNADILAPRPAYNDPSYKEKSARRALLNSLTVSLKGVLRHNEPDIRAMDDKNISYFIDQAKLDAAAQYDAFITKLMHKVGFCTSAELDGNHVWGYSILTVTYTDTDGQHQERFKTQMIVNVSKHGKLFNQWPTRKIKR
jgi:hypothetical protein